MEKVSLMRVFTLLMPEEGAWPILPLLKPLTAKLVAALTKQ
jgi:hypothetical protein